MLKSLTQYRIVFCPKFMTTNPMPGSFASPYAGQGQELLALREYQPGDDLGRVRWGESLRTRKRIIAERMELRDVTIVVVVDCSASMMLREKWEAQRKVASLLLYSAWKAESTFVLAVGDSQFMHPLSGERQFQLAYQTLCEREHADTTSACTNDWAAFCREVRKRVPPRSMIFLLSDFLGPTSFTKLPLPLLRAFAERYDTIAVCLQDDLEYSFPVVGYGLSSIVEDPETGQQHEVWLSQKGQETIRATHQDRLGTIHEQTRIAGVSWIAMPGHSLQEIYRTFSRFFAQRKQR